MKFLFPCLIKAKRSNFCHRVCEW